MNRIKVRHNRSTLVATMALIAVLSFHPLLRGDSVEGPPTQVREWSVTATTASQNVKFSGFSGAAVLVVNDSSSGPDVYITTKATASSSPSAGDSTFTVKTGESINLDIKFNQFSYIAASTTAAIRVIVTSQG